MNIDRLTNSDLNWRRQGLKLFARDYQPGANVNKLPVICLHGLTRNSADFEDIAPILAASGRRVIAPDIRGRGRSEYCADPSLYSPKEYAKDVLALLKAQSISRAVFVGTSMGGIITLILALMKQRVIASAILNDSGPEIDPVGVKRISSYSPLPPSFPNWDEAVLAIKNRYGGSYPNWSAQKWRAMTERSLRMHQGRIVADYDQAIFEPIVAGKAKPKPMLSWFAFRRLARKRPCLLLRGETSDVISEQIVQKMRRSAPEMDYLEVKGVGHAPNLDEPDAQAAILSFLEKHP
jgi:pimeloyl-ACP methyl ester carboxylesterase